MAAPLPVLDRLHEDFHWTPRQRQVLDLIARGHTNPQIAQTLGVSLDGAKWHVREVLTKLGVDSRDDAAEYWRAYNGLRPRFSRILQALAFATAAKWAAGAIALAAVATTTVAVVLTTNDDDGTPAQPSAAPAPSATPTEQPPVDPEALRADWLEKPRFDQVIAGIRVGPTVQPDSSLCANGSATPADPASVAGTPLEITLGYRPPAWPPDNLYPTSTPVVDSVLECSGQLASVGVMAGHRAEPTLPGLMNGGPIQVYRSQLAPGDQPAIRSDIPADHWYASTIAGHPAAIGRPIIDEGLGETEIIIWDDSTLVQTLLRTTDLSLPESLKVAEGLFE